MTKTNADVLIAFESARAGERVEVSEKDSRHPVTGCVIEKSPNGYHDTGWCIRLKIDAIGQVRTEGVSVEIFRENIESIRFLHEEKDLQLSLPFEENQLPLGI